MIVILKIASTVNQPVPYETSLSCLNAFVNKPGKIFTIKADHFPLGKRSALKSFIPGF